MMNQGRGNQGIDRYWAFISYSHADQKAADWLMRALETYRLPSNLHSGSGEKLPSRLFPIFRDRDELASSPSLGGKIYEALSLSRSLIVIASPQSARSRWVSEEIRYYKSLGNHQRVLCLIVDGEPNATDQGKPELECFAPALRFELDAEGQISGTRSEVLAADIRPRKDTHRDAKLKIVAGILDLGLDTLRQRDAHRQYTRVAMIAAVACVVALSTATLAVLAYRARDDAQVQRGLADSRRIQAEGMIQFMLGDLRAKLEPIGKLDILDAVGDQAMKYFAEVDARALSDAELAARALALRQIGSLRIQQGKLDLASPAFREALKLDEEIVRRHPDDQQSIFNTAQSEFYIGYDHFQRMELPQARDWIGQYETSARRLIALDGANPKWQLELAYALGNLAGIATQAENWTECLQRALQKTSLLRGLLEREPQDQPMLMSYAEGLRVGATCAEQGTNDFAQAGQLYAQAVELRQRLLDLAPDNSSYAFTLAVTQLSLASNLIAQGQLSKARLFVDEGSRRFATLRRLDSKNMEWRFFGLQALRQHLELLVLERDSPGALHSVIAALEEAATLRAAQYQPLATRAEGQQLANLYLGIAVTRGSRPLVQDATLQVQKWLLTDANTGANSSRQPERVVACALLAEVQAPMTSEMHALCQKLGAVPLGEDRQSKLIRVLRERAAGGIFGQVELVKIMGDAPWQRAQWQLLIQRSNGSPDEEHLHDG